jgi:FAD/FMN-containing dehydrogenase
MLEVRTNVLAEKLTGSVIVPGDEAYDKARKVWNGMIDRRPALIARCKTPEDVVASVNFARREKLLIAVRGGALQASPWVAESVGWCASMASPATTCARQTS